jgi:G3E family GTPase
VNATAPIHETIKGVINLSHLLDVNAYNAKRTLTTGNEDDASEIRITEATYGLLQDRRLNDDNAALTASTSSHRCTDEGCNEEGQSYSHSHSHARDLQEISTLSIPLPRLTTAQHLKFEELLRALLWDAALPGLSSRSHVHPESSNDSQIEPANDLEILRTKGIFAVLGENKTSSESASNKHEHENQAVQTEYIVQGVKELYEIKALPKLKKQNLNDHDGQGRLVLIGKGLSEDVRDTFLALLLMQD